MLVALAVGVVYVLAGWAGLQFAFLHASASPLWPPAGIALAALLVLGRRAWPVILAAAFTVNVTTGAPAAAALCIAAGNTLEAVAGAYLVGRFAGGRAAFERPADVVRFTLLAGLLSTAVSATVGTTTLVLGGLARPENAAVIWLTWWLGDAGGNLVVAPLLLLWAGPRGPGRSGRHPVEAALLATALVATGAVVFGSWSVAAVRNWPTAFLTIPPFLWAAFRFGPRATATALALLSAMAVVGTLRGHGPFAVGGANTSLLLLQAFMTTMAVSMLSLAVAVRQARRAEETARASEERYRLAAEAGGLGTWEYSVATGAVEWTPALEAIHALPAGAFAGTFDAVLAEAHPDDRERLRQATATAVQAGGAYHLEYRIVRRDGAVRWVEGMGRVLRDGAGRPERMIGVCRDVTDRVRAEADRQRMLAEEQAARRTAQEAERRLGLLGEVARSIAASLDPDTVLQRIADAARALLGALTTAVYRREESGDLVLVAMAGSMGPFGHGDRLGRGLGAVGRAVAERRAVTTGDVLADRAIPLDEPTRGWIEQAPYRAVLAVPLVVKDAVIGAFAAGDRAGRAFTAEDVRVAEALADHAAVAIENARLFAREQAARAQAEEANRAKDEFLAVLSHELRTPMNAVYGWARMLQTGRVEPGTVSRAIDTVVRNAQVQVQLIDDLLDVSRIVVGKLRLDVRAVDLPAVLEAALDAVRPAADAKGLVLEPVLDPRVGPVHGDADRLQQVAWNLLMNAVKFTPRGGRIQVVLRRAEPHAELVVSDTGQGIAPDVLPVIFERFRQADSSSTRAAGGLGIGLALVRHLVELHGGTVSAESAGEGRGATFRVQLPLAAAALVPPGPPAVLAAGGEPPGPALSLRGLRVLLVDDDADALELMQAVFATAGAETGACGTSGEALALLASWRPHALVSDIEMAGEDGYSLIRKVRALRPAEGGDIPAVALTGYGRHEDRIRALAAGYTVHLSKPVDPAEITLVIARLVGRGPHGQRAGP